MGRQKQYACTKNLAIEMVEETSACGGPGFFDRVDVSSKWLAWAPDRP